MRRIIRGVTYDTETPTLVASGDHDHELSRAWWRLYKTPSGAFFEVAAGHDGVVEEITPFTAEQSRRFVEVNANHLVEEYFGSMPDARPTRFSRRTIIAAVEVLEHMIRTHAELTRCLLTWSPELATRCDAGALADRFNHLIKFHDAHPDHCLDDGSLLGDELVEKAVSLLPLAERVVPWRPALDPSPPSPPVAAFLRRLDLDGFTVTGGVLRRTLPPDLELPQAEDDIMRLLKKHGFTTPKGHLDQALDAHALGHWAAANAQLRSFFESLLDEIAIKLDPSAAALASSENRRARLANIGFLKEPLQEWSNDGKNLINGIWKRLHPAGSHPGLSDLDDSTFRRHIVLLTARLLVVRFDATKGT